MRWIIISGLLTWLVIMMTSTTADPPAADSPRARNESARLMQEYRAIIKRANLLRENAKIDAPSPEIRGPFENLSYERRTISIGGSAAPVHMVFDVATGSLIDLSNLALWHYVYDSRPPLLPPRVPATLRREDAIERGRHWIEQILGAFPTGLFPQPEVEYYDTGGEAEGNVRGRWFVIWRRALRGFRYQADSVGVSFLEEYGLCGFTDTRLSQECPTEVRFDRAEAIRRAHAAGRQAMKKFASMYPTGDPGEAVATELLIVHPNGLFTEAVQSLWDLGKAPYGEVRLAWVVDFKGYTHAPEVDKRTEPVETAQIWIDAATGDPLGGDLWLHGLKK